MARSGLYLTRLQRAQSPRGCQSPCVLRRTTPHLPRANVPTYPARVQSARNGSKAHCALIIWKRFCFISQRICRVTYGVEHGGSERLPPRHGTPRWRWMGAMFQKQAQPQPTNHGDAWARRQDSSAYRRAHRRGVGHGPAHWPRAGQSPGAAKKWPKHPR